MVNHGYAWKTPQRILKSHCWYPACLSPRRLRTSSVQFRICVSETETFNISQRRLQSSFGSAWLCFQGSYFSHLLTELMHWWRCRCSHGQNQKHNLEDLGVLTNCRQATISVWMHLCFWDCAIDFAVCWSILDQSISWFSKDCWISNWFTNQNPINQ